MGSVSIKSVLSLAFAFGLAAFALTASALPEGYTQVNYVESTGEQYVNIEYVPNDKTEISLVFSVTEYNSSKSTLFGCTGRTSGGGTKGQCGFAYGIPTTCRWSSTSTDVDLELPDLDYEQHSLVFKNKSYAFDDKVIFTSSSNIGTEGRPLLLLVNNSTKTAGAVNPSGDKASARIYSMTILEDGEYVRNLVPAVDSNGVAGLYDLASSEFFTSATEVPLIAPSGDVEPPAFVEFSASGTKMEGITASVKVVSGEEANATIECYIGTDPETWEPYESWSHTTSATVYETTMPEVDFGSYFVAFRAAYSDGTEMSEVWTETNRLTFVDVKDHWLYDPLTETVTDGMWKFAAEVDGENMSVGKWTDDGYPLDPSLLDFSKPVRDTDQNVYVITNLNTQFGTNAGNWYDINPSEAGGRVAMLVLPESGLVSIRAGAFAGCSSITNIVNFLPDSVQTLGAAAFFGINNTKCVCGLVCNTMNVSDSVFKNATAIKSVAFGPRTKNVGSASHKSSTFSGCTGITNIVFDAACENVNLAKAFKSCRVVELTLNGVTNVADRTFDSCQFRSIIFDKTLQFVSSTAFNDSNGGTARSTLREVRFLGPPPRSFKPEFYGAVAHSPADDNLVTTYVPHKYAAAWQEYATNGEINKKDSTFALEKLTITDDPTKRLLLWGDSAQGLLLLVR